MIELFKGIIWWNYFITYALGISQPILKSTKRRKRTKYVIHIALWAIIRDRLVMDTVLKSYIPNHTSLFLEELHLFLLRVLETFCGAKESWSSARRILSSEIGKTIRTCELTSIAAFSRYHVLTDSVALFFCIFNTRPTIFLGSLWRRANDRNTALETIYGGQFTLHTTQLIKPSFIAK